MWLGLRQLAACVLMSLAGLEPTGAVAADAPRYEVEVKLKIDSKNQSLSAETLRFIQSRARATAALGSRGLNIVMFPDADDKDAQRMIVRGTTVPKLLERLLLARTICGWARDATADAGRAKARHTKYEETGPFELSHWGAAEVSPVYLEVASDERAVRSAAIATRGGEDVLALALEEPGPDHRVLVAGGMATFGEDTAGRAVAYLPLPQAPEEEAAILGLVRLAPQTLPQPVIMLEVQIRPCPAEGEPPTITRRIDALKTAGAEQLEGYMKDPSPLVRWRAVLAAVRLKARRVLERALSDPDAMVQAPARAALRSSSTARQDD